MKLQLPPSIGILVLLALGFLMPSLAYIPKAILSSVIITSVIFMVEFEELKPMWKSRSTIFLPIIPLLMRIMSCLQYRLNTFATCFRIGTDSVRSHFLLLSLCQHGVRHLNWSRSSFTFVGLHGQSSSPEIDPTARKSRFLTLCHLP